MTLPKQLHPTFDATVPSTKKRIKIRPMTRREEKILLMAKSGTSPYEIFSAVRQVVVNCIASGDFDANSLTIFDLEYLFIRVRIVSHGGDLYVTVMEGEVENRLPIKLEDVNVKFPEDIQDVVKIGPATGIKLKYPLASMYEDPVFFDPETTPDTIFDLLIDSCLDSYFDDDKVVKFGDHTREEVRAWLDDLEVGPFGKVRAFVDNLPALYYKVEYKNKAGEDQSFVLNSLTDFFTLA
jgi:hypothetical protein